ncbi:hypothetical protein GCM10009682_46040 [Luedemannella flava]|uniref:Uncharacterized protein n=1 Tax=Luedemannella flava TaxID=349316 RepID=A0ABN2MCC7_9ACTN
MGPDAVDHVGVLPHAEEDHLLDQGDQQPTQQQGAGTRTQQGDRRVEQLARGQRPGLLAGWWCGCAHAETPVVENAIMVA